VYLQKCVTNHRVMCCWKRKESWDSIPQMRKNINVFTLALTTTCYGLWFFFFFTIPTRVCSFIKIFWDVEPASLVDFDRLIKDEVRCSQTSVNVYRTAWCGETSQKIAISSFVYVRTRNLTLFIDADHRRWMASLFHFSNCFF
jgi:hypothetical protein